MVSPIPIVHPVSASTTTSNAPVAAPAKEKTTSSQTAAPPPQPPPCYRLPLSKDQADSIQAIRLKPRMLRPNPNLPASGLPLLVFTANDFYNFLGNSLRQKGYLRNPPELYITGSSALLALCGNHLCNDLDLSWYISSSDQLNSEVFRGIFNLLQDFIQSRLTLLGRPNYSRDFIASHYLYKKTLIPNMYAPQAAWYGLGDFEIKFVLYDERYSNRFNVASVDGLMIDFQGTYVQCVNDCQPCVEKQLVDSLNDLRFRRIRVQHPEKVKKLLFRLAFNLTNGYELQASKEVISTALKNFQTEYPLERLENLTRDFQVHQQNHYPDNPLGEIFDSLNLLALIQQLPDKIAREKYAQSIALHWINSNKKSLREFYELIQLKPNLTYPLLKIAKGLLLHEWVSGSKMLKGYEFEFAAGAVDPRAQIRKTKDKTDSYLYFAETPIAIAAQLLIAYEAIYKEIQESEGEKERLKKLPACLQIQHLELTDAGRMKILQDLLNGFNRQHVQSILSVQYQNRLSLEDFYSTVNTTAFAENNPHELQGYSILNKLNRLLEPYAKGANDSFKEFLESLRHYFRLPQLPHTLRRLQPLTMRLLKLQASSEKSYISKDPSLKKCIQESIVVISHAVLAQKDSTLTLLKEAFELVSSAYKKELIDKEAHDATTKKLIGNISALKYDTADAKKELMQVVETGMIKNPTGDFYEPFAFEAFKTALQGSNRKLRDSFFTLFHRAINTVDKSNGREMSSLLFYVLQITHSPFANHTPSTLQVIFYQFTSSVLQKINPFKDSPAYTRAGIKVLTKLSEMTTNDSLKVAIADLFEDRILVLLQMFKKETTKETAEVFSDYMISYASLSGVKRSKDERDLLLSIAAKNFAELNRVGFITSVAKYNREFAGRTLKALYSQLNPKELEEAEKAIFSAKEIKTASDIQAEWKIKIDLIPREELIRKIEAMVDYLSALLNCPINQDYQSYSKALKEYPLPSLLNENSLKTEENLLQARALIGKALDSLNRCANDVADTLIEEIVKIGLHTNVLSGETVFRLCEDRLKQDWSLNSVPHLIRVVFKLHMQDSPEKQVKILKELINILYEEPNWEQRSSTIYECVQLILNFRVFLPLLETNLKLPTIPIGHNLLDRGFPEAIVDFPGMVHQLEMPKESPLKVEDASITQLSILEDTNFKRVCLRLMETLPPKKQKNLIELLLRSSSFFRWETNDVTAFLKIAFSKKLEHFFAKKARELCNERRPLFKHIESLIRNETNSSITNWLYQLSLNNQSLTPQLTGSFLANALNTDPTTMQIISTDKLKDYLASDSNKDPTDRTAILLQYVEKLILSQRVASTFEEYINLVWSRCQNSTSPSPVWQNRVVVILTHSSNPAHLTHACKLLVSQQENADVLFQRLLQSAQHVQAQEFNDEFRENLENTCYELTNQRRLFVLPEKTDSFLQQLLSLQAASCSKKHEVVPRIFEYFLNSQQARVFEKSADPEQVITRQQSIIRIFKHAIFTLQHLESIAYFDEIKQLCEAAESNLDPHTWQACSKEAQLVFSSHISFCLNMACTNEEQLKKVDVHLRQSLAMWTKYNPFGAHKVYTRFMHLASAYLTYEQLEKVITAYAKQIQEVALYDTALKTVPQCDSHEILLDRVDLKSCIIAKALNHRTKQSLKLAIEHFAAMTQLVDHELDRDSTYDKTDIDIIFTLNSLYERIGIHKIIPLYEKIFDQSFLRLVMNQSNPLLNLIDVVSKALKNQKSDLLFSSTTSIIRKLLIYPRVIKVIYDHLKHYQGQYKIKSLKQASEKTFTNTFQHANILSSYHHVCIQDPRCKIEHVRDISADFFTDLVALMQKDSDYKRACSLATLQRALTHAALLFERLVLFSGRDVAKLVLTYDFYTKIYALSLEQQDKDSEPSWNLFRKAITSVVINYPDLKRLCDNHLATSNPKAITVEQNWAKKSDSAS